MKASSCSLAISHIRGNKRKYTPCRYDFIYATEDIELINIKYLYDEAIEAGSGHALVLAELEYKNNSQESSPLFAKLGLIN